MSPANPTNQQSRPRPQGHAAVSTTRPAGFFPVYVGKIIHNRYRIVLNIGYGRDSTVWLAGDLQKKKYVTLKIGMEDSNADEIDTLKILSASNSRLPTGHPISASIPTVLDEFQVQSPDGLHTCYTMAPSQGSLIQMYGEKERATFPLNVARALSYALAKAVSSIHSRGFVHGDLQPRNILIQLPKKIATLTPDELFARHKSQAPTFTRFAKGENVVPDTTKTELNLPLFFGGRNEDLKLADARLILSGFCFSFSPNMEVRLNESSTILPGYRPPEATLDPGAVLSFPSDIWSLAALIWKIMGVLDIFSPGEMHHADEIVSEVIEVLGPIPKEWHENWEAKDYYLKRDGTVKRTSCISGEETPGLKGSFEWCIQRYRREDADEITEGEKTAFLELIDWMLSYRTQGRPTVKEVLSSKWMVKYALPDYERSLGFDLPFILSHIH